MSRISVIVPVYNTEDYAERCIRSILEQSWKDLELILVNDGSEGNIAGIARRFAQKDPRVRYIESPKNEGLFLARLRGIRCATGEYIGFVDSDDYIGFDYYRGLIGKAVETGADIVIGRTVQEEGEKRYIYNLHESSLHFNTLEGGKLRERFFGQELNCYAWHTVWNKLYRRSLVEKGMPYWENLRAHIVMAEDVAFSVVLFWFARRAAAAPGDPYFYCAHRGAATDSVSMPLHRFVSSVCDLRLVFDFCGDFLRQQSAGEVIIRHFERGREHFGRMWRHLLEEQRYTAANYEECRTLLDEFRHTPDLSRIDREYYFESIRTEYRGGLAYLKEQIAAGDEPVISFDIFDTLLTRPFYTPADLFTLLDPVFAKAGGGTAGFRALRTAAEEAARARAVKESDGRREDVSLDEIYDELRSRFLLPAELAENMRRKEVEMELAVSACRRSGKELFELARAAGKRIILVSDMYLPLRVVRKMLRNAGFDGYEKLFLSGECGLLKGSGRLFMHALSVCGLRPGQVLHIGDSWKSDIEGSKKAGIRALFLPAATEVFENRVGGCRVNRCGSLGAGIAGVFRVPAPAPDPSGAGAGEPGTGVMLAMAARGYFDDPYRSFCGESDLNADPYMIGAYPLGMHLLGLAFRIRRKMDLRKGKRLVFLGRDGFLVREVCLRLQKAGLFDAETLYIHASRRTLLPAMLRTRADFFCPPCDPCGHSPVSLLRLYSFASKEIALPELRRRLAEDGFEPDGKFRDRAGFEELVRWFLQNMYCEELHETTVGRLREKYTFLSGRDVLFDVGYSGRLPETLGFLAGCRPEVFYVHANMPDAAVRSETGQFNIETFYSLPPSVSGLLREFVLTEPPGDESVPGLYAAENFALQSVRDGVLDFVDRFLALCAKMSSPEILYPHSGASSMPWEAFLAAGSDMDWNVFSQTWEDDYVYAGRGRICISELAAQCRERNARLQTFSGGEMPSGNGSPAGHPRPLAVRAFLLLLRDRRQFFEKVRRRLKGSRRT